MKFTRSILFTFTALSLLVTGCLHIKPRDPLPVSQGWKSLELGREIRTVPKAVIEDSQAYIQRLPKSERSQVTLVETAIKYFGNTNGQHAVFFEIGKPALFGEIIWAHVLIYDQNNKRVKVMKYKSDRAVII
jgi:hypothetical protein